MLIVLNFHIDSPGSEWSAIIVIYLMLRFHYALANYFWVIVCRQLHALTLLRHLVRCSERFCSCIIREILCVGVFSHRWRGEIIDNVSESHNLTYSDSEDLIINLEVYIDHLFLLSGLLRIYSLHVYLGYIRCEYLSHRLNCRCYAVRVNKNYPYLFLECAPIISSKI